MPACIAAFPASAQSTTVAGAALRRQSTAAAIAVPQPAVTLTWKPSRSVSGQVGRSLPSSRSLQKGRKPPGRTHSSVWWATRIGSPSSATQASSARSASRLASAAPQVGPTSAAAPQSQRP